MERHPLQLATGCYNAADVRSAQTAQSASGFSKTDQHRSPGGGEMLDHPLDQLLVRRREAVITQLVRLDPDGLLALE
jgi:hypothetical protein